MHFLCLWPPFPAHICTLPTPRRLRAGPPRKCRHAACSASPNTSPNTFQIPQPTASGALQHNCIQEVASTSCQHLVPPLLPFLLYLTPAMLACVPDLLCSFCHLDGSPQGLQKPPPHSVLSQVTPYGSHQFSCATQSVTSSQWLCQQVLHSPALPRAHLNAMVSLSLFLLLSLQDEC